MPFGLVGYIVAVRQPANPLGWILLGLAFVFTLASDAGAYAILAYRQGWTCRSHGSRSSSRPSGPRLVLLAPLAVGLFPDGRLTPGWRRAVAAYVVLSTLLLTWMSWTNVSGIGAARIRIDSTGALKSTDHSPAPRPASRCCSSPSASPSS